MGKRIVHAVVTLLLASVVAGAIAGAARLGLLALADALSLDTDAGWPTIVAVVLWVVLALFGWLAALGRRASRTADR